MCFLLLNSEEPVKNFIKYLISECFLSIFLCNFSNNISILFSYIFNEQAIFPLNGDIIKGWIIFTKLASDTKHVFNAN